MPSEETWAWGAWVIEKSLGNNTLRGKSLIQISCQKRFLLLSSTCRRIWELDQFLVIGLRKMALKIDFQGGPMIRLGEFGDKERLRIPIFLPHNLMPKRKRILEILPHPLKSRAKFHKSRLPTLSPPSRFDNLIRPQTIKAMDFLPSISLRKKFLCNWLILAITPFGIWKSDI